jgi:hypothetical protein
VLLWIPYWIRQRIVTLFFVQNSCLDTNGIHSGGYKSANLLFSEIKINSRINKGTIGGISILAGAPPPAGTGSVKRRKNEKS